MRILSEADLLAWVEPRGIRLDGAYPKVVILTFAPEVEQSRFWHVPREPERRPHFMWTMLRLLGNWKSCFVWQHSGSWAARVDPNRINDAVELRILGGLGVPVGTAEVLEFERTEIDAIVTLMFAKSVFGWAVQDDLYVIPDHARYVVQTDHHEVIHVSFQTPVELAAFTKGMEAAGFPLPDDVPDATFKKPDWMKGGGGPPVH